MITINDNSVPQINAALLRLNNVVDMDVSKLETNIDKLKSDTSKITSKLQQEIDEITAGTKIYTAGSHINISSAGVISVVDVNKVLNIKRNGVSVGTFTALATNDSTVDIQVPTKTSELTNDSDYVVDSGYVHTDNNFTNDFKTGLNSLLTDGTIEQFYCETDGWVKNKTARAILTRTPTREGLFMVWFKRLNWYYDGSYCTVTFSDDPNTEYNIRMDNNWGTGSYGPSASCCFGCGWYMARIVSGTYCYISPLDFKARYVPYYGANVVPMESEEYFETTPVVGIYGRDCFDYFNKSDNVIPALLPTMYVTSSTRIYGRNAAGVSGSGTGCTYNGLTFGTGTLIQQGEYLMERRTDQYGYRHIQTLDYRGYTEYISSPNVTVTQTYQTIFTHPSSLVNKRIEILVRGARGSDTYNGSAQINISVSGYSYQIPLNVTDDSVHNIWVSGNSSGAFSIKLKTNDSWTSIPLYYNIKVYN